MRDRERQLQQLRRRLDTCDLGRRLAAIRTRLVTVDGRVTGAMGRRWQRADARLRECAGRLETLSPLAVLGRGYAVCWNADRTQHRARRLDGARRANGFGSRSPAASCTARCEPLTPSLPAAGILTNAVTLDARRQDATVVCASAGHG